MLPKTQNGDSRLVHSWDELNIITSGSAKFTKDDGTVDVKKGSIVYVEAGNGHRFNFLNSDTDIFILWNQ